MDRVVSKTVDVLTRFGESIERRLSTGGGDYDDDDDGSYGIERSGSGSAFHRPLDKTNYQEYKRRDSSHGRARRSSSDNLAAMPGSYRHFQQNSMTNPYADGFARPPYGTGIGGPLNYGYSGQPGVVPYGSGHGNIGYAPDYYVAERRQVELVPVPPPRYIQQPVPVPVPVDRPVPQPYPVRVPVAVPVDRPVPVPVPTPVPVDRPVPVPVPVAVPSPPVHVPVPVPSPVPCYVPVAVPVPSPPPSPVMVENSVTYTQRWVDGSSGTTNQNYRAGSPLMMSQDYRAGSPVMMNQDYRAGSPVMMSQDYRAGSPMMMNQNYRPGSPLMMNQDYRAGSPVMMNQQYQIGTPVMINRQHYIAASPAMAMNPCAVYGQNSFIR